VRLAIYILAEKPNINISISAVKPSGSDTNLNAKEMKPNLRAAQTLYFVPTPGPKRNTDTRKRLS
jgi:hypothetical protein